jgi:hypothetical protein
MPADPFTLRQADQARTDFAIIEDELEAIHKRLTQLPTRNEVWRAAMLGMLGGAVAAVTLIEAFSDRVFEPRYPLRRAGLLPRGSAVPRTGERAIK